MKTILTLIIFLFCLVETPATAQIRRTISFDNNCPKALRVWISHADGYRNWHVHGPFDFSSMEGPTRLENNGVVLTQTEGHAVYIYAETVDGSKIWQGRYAYEYNGTIFNMMQANTSITSGRLLIDLICPA